MLTLPSRFPPLREWQIALSPKAKNCYTSPARVPFPYTLEVNVFDLIVLAILVALTLRGIWKGMVSQIVSVASYFVCWIVATRFGSLVAPTIPLEAPWDQVVAMAVVFLITLVAIRFAQAALEKLIKDWHLDKLNKTLGGILGFTKGLLLCFIITFFAVMLSDTSRAVVFNSKSGSHLVQLITRISLFVPKDSYEFVHTQFAKFESKIDGVVPSQTPETIPVQSSKTAQQMLAQLQQKEPSASSLWTAISKWWNGSKEETSDTETVSPTRQTAQASVQTLTQAVPYTPPVQQIPSSPAQPAGTYANVPQPVASSPSVVQDFFVRQTASAASPPAQQLPALPSLPAVAVASPQPSTSSPLSDLPEASQLLPILPMPHHVGSDLLLNNSGRITNSNASARVFRYRGQE